MRYKLLGRSGLRVSEISLGTMTFGEDWGWGASKEESRKIFDAYVDAGGNFIDTANLYTNGTSETFVGEFVKDRRDDFVVATKFSLNTNRESVNGGGNHRKNLTHALDASLKRLGTDYIDLYWLHAWDFYTPVDEVMRALDDAVRAGKILYIGISDTPAWLVSRANTMAELRGWTRFVGLQIRYSLIDRTVERELTPMAASLDLAVAAWAPLAAGLLTGKYDQGVKGDAKGGRIGKRSPDGSEFSDRDLAIAREVSTVAKEIGCSPAQVAMNWVRSRGPAVHIPIVGARTLAQIEDNIGCLDFELSHDHIERLNKVSDFDLGFPHNFLTEDRIKGILYGDHADEVDLHRVRD